MSTAEIRKSLHEAIDSADETRLHELQELISDLLSGEDGWDTLSPDIQTSIEKGLKDAETGRVYKHEEVMKTLREKFLK